MKLNTKSPLILLALLVISLLISLFILKPTGSPPPDVAPIQGVKDDPYGAIEFRFHMIAGENGFIDPAARIKAAEHTRLFNKIPLNKSELALSWTSLGPGNIGGRIRGVVIKSSNSNHILIGSVSGGIWKSTNGGSSWTPKLDGGTQIAIGCMVRDPYNENIVFAGTGEGWGNSDAVYGGGIYKSTDFGESWTLLAATTVPWNFKNINQLAFDPSGNLYAVTKAYNFKHGVGSYYQNGGLYKSTDSGSSWTKISSTNTAHNGFNGTDVIPFSSSTIVFAVNENGSTLGGIYKTTNGGTSWSKVSSGLPASGYKRIAFAKDPVTANTAYAVIQSTNNDAPEYGLKGIYKTTDAGSSWTLLPTPPRLTSVSNRSYLGTQGWYNNVIAVDPFNNNNVYVGGVDMMKSTNKGNSWSQLTFWHTYYGTPFVHADHHSIVFDPNTSGVLYSGNDGGIYKSTNGGANWVSLNNGLAITQFYGGAVSYSGATYHGGTQDNGHLSYYGSGINWAMVYGGDGGFAAVDQSNANVAYEEYVFLAMHKTKDAGTSWWECLNGLTDAKNSSLCLFIAPFAMNPENTRVLIAGSDKVWITADSTSNWTQSSSTSLASGYKISAVTVVGANANYLGFAGTTNGKIFKCTSLNPASGFELWNEITPGNNLGSWVRRIVVDPGNKQKIYACYSGYKNSTPANHVYYSTNQGSSWTDISSNLPDVPVHSLVIHPTIPNRLYIGTETGVYETTNNGTTWTHATTGMPDYVPVDELVLQKSTNKMFAFTHGRSAFVCTLPSATGLENSTPEISSYELKQNYPNPFNSLTIINYQLPVAGDVRLKVFDASGSEIAVLVDEHKTPGNYSVVFNAATLPSGVYFYRMTTDGFSETKKLILIK
ncbi:MAG TPA: T9SS type A sorting domain-containing protein [Ignavibacteriaceae bacterium]|nr:T9SS type A sorting domain-containing protein [Ignavibacteriaceae bacterium]